MTEATWGLAQHLIKREPVYFAPTDYLLGIVTHAVEAGDDLRITLSGNGDVAIFPGRGLYFAQVADMAEFCRAPASALKTAKLNAADWDALQHAAAPRSIKELLWQAAFHASQGRLVQSRTSNDSVHLYDVIKFHHWPNLTRLPMTSNTMRICALLTRQPSSIVLIPRKLRIEAEELYQVYSAACSSGLVHVVSDHLREAAVADTEEPAEAPHQHGLLRSLLEKLTGL